MCNKGGTDNIDLPQRKRIRLDNYDYAQGGGYFFTINVQDHIPLLGNMDGQVVLLNEVGSMVQEVWNNLPQYYPGVMLDAFVVMPDHIHGIVILTDPWLIEAENGPARSAAPTQEKPIKIPTLMRRFKSYTTKRYWEIKVNHSGSRLPEKLWQRSYYERVIRSDSDLAEKRDYITTNPLRLFLKSNV